MTSYTILKDMTQIPETGRICIYGAGGYGKQFKNFIDKRRPDMEIVCFADTYQSGEFEGLPIVNQEALSAIHDLDAIYVLSMYWKEITECMPQMSNVVVILPVTNVFSSVNPNHPLGISAEIATKVSNTRSLFQNMSEKMLYDEIVRIRCDIPCSIKTQSDVWPEQQYLDFIRYDRVKLAIEGGVFDGSTALGFLKRMPPGSQLIGFEPLSEIYESSPVKKVLDQQFPDAVTIETAALWNNSQTLHFERDVEDTGHLTGGSKVVEKFMAITETCTVPGIALDDYVREKGFDKVDFIKMDIEGAEVEALRGARETIIKHRPQMAICIYHTNEHVYQIPLLIAEFVDNYQFHLGHYSHELFGDSVFYAIPNEIATLPT